MIILDTNVLSETQKTAPDDNVMGFLNSLDPTSTYMTAISAAEILYGIDILPMGRRKKELEDSAFKIIQDVFKNRVLPFDADAASRYAINAADARRNGHAVAFADGMIAGIALSNGATIATRDTAPFRAMRVPTIDPWEPMPKKAWTIED